MRKYRVITDELSKFVYGDVLEIGEVNKDCYFKDHFGGIRKGVVENTPEWFEEILEKEHMEDSDKKGFCLLSREQVEQNKIAIVELCKLIYKEIRRDKPIYGDDINRIMKIVLGE